jgi:hypothetical protein
MVDVRFEPTFQALTGNLPFPWQLELHKQFVRGEFPASCSLGTGLGKTAVIPIWLIALALAPQSVPRRLVYVVNRRTVVDQATREAEEMRTNLVRVPELASALKKLSASVFLDRTPVAGQIRIVGRGLASPNCKCNNNKQSCRDGQWGLHDPALRTEECDPLSGEQNGCRQQSRQDRPTQD